MTYHYSHLTPSNSRLAVRNSKFPILFSTLLFPLCSLLLTPCWFADAQQATKVAHIGFLDAVTAAGSAGLLEAFWWEMRKLGWFEGKNITIEYRFGEGETERGHQTVLAADLVRLKVDLIVVAGTPPALAAKKATTTIPIL